MQIKTPIIFFFFFGLLVKFGPLKCYGYLMKTMNTPAVFDVVEMKVMKSEQFISDKYRGGLRFLIISRKS